MSDAIEPPFISAEDEFAVPIGTGMQRLEHGVDFDRETADRLRRRLDEFDAMRTRGAVESRTAWIDRSRRA
jgi:hypothetical protein